MRRTTRRQLLTGAVIGLSPIVAGAAWPVRYFDRLYPGVQVAGLNRGGSTRAEAAAQIE